MEFQWRQATDADWNEAWTIQRAAFLDLVTRTWGGWDDTQVRKCAEAWDAPRTRVVLVEGAMAGWVRTDHLPSHDWLDVVIVAPRMHGQGLGTKVMRRLMAEASERGVPLWLSVYRENRSRRLYNKLGFGVTPRDTIRLYMMWPATAASDGPPA
jgi:GNAT superfamily N-acetyltransferase